MPLAACASIDVASALTYARCIKRFLFHIYFMAARQEEPGRMTKHKVLELPEHAFQLAQNPRTWELTHLIARPAFTEA